MFPRWLSLMFILVLGYMLYASNTGTRAPHTATAPTAIPAITEESYPALAHLTDAERWKRTLNPDYAATMNCSVDAAPRAALSLKIMEDIAGTGTGATCGERIHVQLTIWKNDGHKAFDAPVTLALGKRELAAGLDAGLQGIAIGGVRTLLLPPTALVRSKTSNAPATARAALPDTQTAVVTVKRLK